MIDHPNEGPTDAAESTNDGSRPRLIRIVMGAAALVGLFVLSKFVPIVEWLDASRGFVDDLGIWGPLVYGLFYVVAALFFIPGAVITIFAGTLFGLATGSIVVSIASTLSAAIALPLARTLFRKRVESFAKGRPAFDAIDSAISDGDWKVVGLLRLSPVVPFSALNYMLGLTSVRYVPAVLISWLAMLPGTVLYVYIGTLPNALADDREKRASEWVLLGVGLSVTLAVTVLLTRMAKKRMESAHDIDGAQAQGTQS